MELLLALLISFGVVTKEEATKISSDSSKIYELSEKAGIDEKKIEEYKLSIIEMEDADM